MERRFGKRLRVHGVRGAAGAGDHTRRRSRAGIGRQPPVQPLLSSSRAVPHSTSLCTNRRPFRAESIACAPDSDREFRHSPVASLGGEAGPDAAVPRRAVAPPRRGAGSRPGARSRTRPAPNRPPGPSGLARRTGGAIRRDRGTPPQAAAKPGKGRGVSEPGNPAGAAGRFGTSGGPTSGASMPKAMRGCPGRPPPRAWARAPATCLTPWNLSDPARSDRIVSRAENRTAVPVTPSNQRAPQEAPHEPRTARPPRALSRPLRRRAAALAAQAAQRERLAAEERPRLLLISRACLAPDCVDELEDWVREPLDPEELESGPPRSSTAPACAHCGRGSTSHGLVRVGDRWVDLPTVQLPVAATADRRLGRVVPAERDPGDLSERRAAARTPRR